MIARRTALLPAATFVAAVLALPPVNAWPFAFILLLPVLWLVARLGAAPSLWVGLLTGATFGAYLYFGAAVLDPLAMMGATAALALCCGLFTACSARLLQQPTLLSPVLIGALWVAIELLLEACAIPFTLAVMLTEAPALLQSASIGGQHLLVFFIVAIQSAVIAWSVQPGRHARAYVAALCIVAFGVTTAVGQSQQPTPIGTLSVAAMQTDIHPFFYVHAEADSHLALLEQRRQQLAAQLTDQPVELVVWPEVAFARFEWRRPGKTPHERSYASLVAGNDVGPDGRQYNVVFGVDASGSIRSRHVKNTLLPRLEREYAATNVLAPHTQLPGRPGSLICFESAFPKTAGELSQRGAQILTIATSDTYAGPSLLSAFHASFAILRAVETRRAIVRAANAGPSMIVLPDGHVLGNLPQFEAGVLTGTVPLIDQPSFYATTATAWRIAFGLLGIVSLFVALPVGGTVRTRPNWLGIGCTLLLVLPAALIGQWRSATEQYRAAREMTRSVRVDFGFLSELTGAASYRALRSEREQDDLPAVVAGALRRFGIDVTGQDVAQRKAQLRASTINKIDAQVLFEAYGFSTTPLENSAAYSVMPCAATLTDGSSVLITRHAPDALQIFAPGEGGYSTVPRTWLTLALDRAPVCVVGRGFAWDLQ